MHFMFIEIKLLCITDVGYVSNALIRLNAFFNSELMFFVFAVAVSVANFVG